MGVQIWAEEKKEEGEVMVRDLPIDRFYAGPELVARYSL